LRLIVLCTVAAAAFAAPRHSAEPSRIWDDNCGGSFLGANACPEGGHKGLRVVGGWEAQPNSLPWMVSLLWFGSHFCGGSIVTNRHIITAAHCVAGDNPSQLRVRVGAHSRAGSTEFDVTYDVIANDWHPQYDLTGNLENDVAVLTVAEDITFTDGRVGPICAPVDDKSSDYYSGLPCHTSGWGTTSSGGSSSDVLLYTNIEVTSYQTCVDTHPAGWVEPGMLCAGRPDNGWDRDACQGDSGGPLYLYDNDAWVLIGQVSWGIGCAGLTPGVYADTAYYIDWFAGIIN